MLRTRNAGSLRAAGHPAAPWLTGWLIAAAMQAFTFIDLRDASGIARVTIREDVAHELRNEFCIRVTAGCSRTPRGQC